MDCKVLQKIQKKFLDKTYDQYKGHNAVTDFRHYSLVFIFMRDIYKGIFSLDNRDSNQTKLVHDVKIVIKPMD